MEYLKNFAIWKTITFNNENTFKNAFNNNEKLEFSSLLCCKIKYELANGFIKV